MTQYNILEYVGKRALPPAAVLRAQAQSKALASASQPGWWVTS